jgi:hypothetical protein
MVGMGTLFNQGADLGGCFENVLVGAGGTVTCHRQLSGDDEGLIGTGLGGGGSGLVEANNGGNRYEDWDGVGGPGGAETGAFGGSVAVAGEVEADESGRDRKKIRLGWCGCRRRCRCGRWGWGHRMFRLR